MISTINRLKKICLHFRRENSKKMSKTSFSPITRELIGKFQIYKITYSGTIGPNVGDDILLKSSSSFIGNIQMYVFPFKNERVFASMLIK